MLTLPMSIPIATSIGGPPAGISNGTTRSRRVSDLLHRQGARARDRARVGAAAACELVRASRALAGRARRAPRSRSPRARSGCTGITDVLGQLEGLAEGADDHLVGGHAADEEDRRDAGSSPSRRPRGSSGPPSRRGPRRTSGGRYPFCWAWIMSLLAKTEQRPAILAVRVALAATCPTSSMS